MPYCPICGSEVEARSPECPVCHLDVGLFDPVRDAALLNRDSDPVYYRTIAELLRSVDLFGPAPELAEPETPMAPVASPAVLPAAPDLPEPTLGPAPSALIPLPAVPDFPAGDALRSRAHEYRTLAASLGIDVTSLGARADAAEETDDESALNEAVREMFVHLASALIQRFDRAAAKSAELSSRARSETAEEELDAVRAGISGGDLTGASRHLARANEELARLDEGWATERILLAECDLLVETIRELGGDPRPALGPLEEGRKRSEANQREDAELLLAQTTYALWVLLEPRFTEELKRIRDRLVELRHSGADVGPALAKLRAVATEIRRRNFGGTVTFYRQLRALVGRSVESGPLEAPPSPARASPPA